MVSIVTQYCLCAVQQLCSVLRLLEILKDRKEEVGIVSAAGFDN
jgi:hypothetical protein